MTLTIDVADRLDLLKEACRMKSVACDTPLTCAARRETAAERAWHAALWALIFADAFPEARIDRVIETILVSDLGLIDDGPSASLFGDRSDTTAKRWSALDAFRAKDGPDARAAQAIRQAQALFQRIFEPDFSRLDRDLLRADLTTGADADLIDIWPELHGHAMALLDRRRPASSAQMRARLAFVMEADQLKIVERGTPIWDRSRRERSGEHSWHIALYALALSDCGLAPVDRSRVVAMLLIHDLVEIDAGDAPIHGNFDAATVAVAEAAAADRIFGLLPADQGRALRASWDAFEAGSDTDAVFARSLDRVQPVVSNLMTDGGSWIEYRVTRAQLESRVGAKVRRGAPLLWETLTPVLDAWFDGLG